MEPKGAGAGSTVKAAYTIGRFQPPTLGHVRMIDAMLDKAKGAPTFVFVSAVDIYVPPAMKVEYLRKMLTREGVFPENLTLIDTSKDCETPCGGPLGGFGYLKDRGMVGPDVVLFVGGDRLNDFNPKTAPMWSTIPEEERPSIQALPRVGEGAATFSSTDARKAVMESGDLSKYLKVKINAVTEEDVGRMQKVLEKALSKPAKKKTKGGANDDSVLDEGLDGGRRRRQRTRRNGGRKNTSTREATVKKGGAIIASGASNEVYSVPFPCTPPLPEGKPFVMLIGKRLKNAVKSGAKEEELRKIEEAEPSRPLPGVLEVLRRIDANFDRFYYPIACTPRAPKQGEAIDPELEGLTDDQRARLAPFVQIIPYAPRGTLATMRKPTKAQGIKLRESVELLHANGVAHYDISVYNIVRASDGFLRIIDFGQSVLKNGDGGVITQPLFEGTVEWDEAVEEDIDNIDYLINPPPSLEGGRRTRRVTRNKASSKALSRRGLRSRTGS